MPLREDVQSAWTQATANRTATLKVVFFLHLLFTTLASSAEWLPVGSVMYNAIFLVSLLWGIHTQSRTSEPVQMALWINILCILFDIWTMIIYPPRSGGLRYDFGRAFAVVNLIHRPLTSFALHRYIKKFTTTFAPAETVVTHTLAMKQPGDGHNQTVPPPPYELAGVHSPSPPPQQKQRF